MASKRIPVSGSSSSLNQNTVKTTNMKIMATQQISQKPLVSTTKTVQKSTTTGATGQKTMGTTVQKSTGISTQKTSTTIKKSVPTLKIPSPIPSSLMAKSIPTTLSPTNTSNMSRVSNISPISSRVSSRTSEVNSRNSDMSSTLDSRTTQTTELTDSQTDLSRSTITSSRTSSRGSSSRASDVVSSRTSSRGASSRASDASRATITSSRLSNSDLSSRASNASRAASSRASDASRAASSRASDASRATITNSRMSNTSSRDSRTTVTSVTTGVGTKGIRITKISRVPTVESLKDVLSNAGLEIVEGLVIDGNPYVRTYNTSGQKVVVALSNEYLSLVESMISHVSASVDMTERDESITDEVISRVMGTILHNSSPMISGYHSELNGQIQTLTKENIHTGTSFESTSYKCENGKCSYGHVSGDVVPSPIVSLEEVIVNGRAIDDITARETVQIQRSIVKRTQSDLQALIKISEQLMFLARQMDSLAKSKFFALGSKIEGLVRTDRRLATLSPTSRNIEVRGEVHDSLVYHNYVLNRMLGHLVSLEPTMDSLNDSISNIQSVKVAVEKELNIPKDGIILPSISV